MKKGKTMTAAALGGQASSLREKKRMTGLKKEYRKYLIEHYMREY